MKLSVLKAIFASMKQGIVFVDDQGRIAFCNPAAEEIRNIRETEVAGRSILECHPLSFHPSVLKILEDLRSGKIEGHQKMNIQMVRGKFYDNTFAAVWGPRKEYLGAVVVSQEVTERKKAEDELKNAMERLRLANEELKSLDQMKNDFFSSVSHELKTPMISVMGYIGMVLKEKAGTLTEEQKKFLEISYKNLLRLGKNIDNLLDLAELRIHKKTWTFEHLDLRKVIEFSCLTIDPLAREHQIQMEVQLPPDPVWVSGVEDKLNQLFDNLLTNAIKYNQEGGKIAVELYADPEYAYARIVDTGVGIPRQSLKEVFTRYFQEKAKPLGNAKGLGIGLSLVQEIVELHHGEVHLESELGKGATFIVKLPRDSSELRVQSSEKSL
ncbi:MAG: PAS domain-containing protein [Syntrophaceae bacterium]|nr:PAS domain-containing protein [Syntrophaceae bacterium]